MFQNNINNKKVEKELFHETTEICFVKGKQFNDLLANIYHERNKRTITSQLCNMNPIDSKVESEKQEIDMLGWVCLADYF